MTALTFFESLNFFLIDSGQSTVMIGQSKVLAADLDWFAMSGALGVASAVVLALFLSDLRLATSTGGTVSSCVPS